MNIDTIKYIGEADYHNPVTLTCINSRGEMIDFKADIFPISTKSNILYLCPIYQGGSIIDFSSMPVAVSFALDGGKYIYYNITPRLIYYRGIPCYKLICEEPAEKVGKRSAYKVSCLLPGWVQFENEISQCVITDISDNGANIMTDLKIPTGKDVSIGVLGNKKRKSYALSAITTKDSVNHNKHSRIAVKFKDKDIRINQIMYDVQSSQCSKQNLIMAT